MNERVIVLGVSLATTAVGGGILYYLRKMRGTARTHMLRHEEVDHFIKRL
jgi:hypothetical protein